MSDRCGAFAEYWVELGEPEGWLGCSLPKGHAGPHKDVEDEKKAVMPIQVKRTERGWAGHFCASSRCLFRRNTLLEAGDVKIVVSTVGLLENPFYGDKSKGILAKGRFDTIGVDRYFETMAFHSNPADTRYHDIDVSRHVAFDSPWAISKIDADDKANDMHEAVVAEIITKLERGELKQ